MFDIHQPVFDDYGEWLEEGVEESQVNWDGFRNMTRRQFEKLVREALDELPEQFRARLGNVDITVEEAPTLEILESVGLTEDDLLLGRREAGLAH